MNNIEEKLWAYIDGTASAEDHATISLLIEQNEAYRQKYQELLALNNEFEAMELDEPPMAFTYNVMEVIRADYAQKPLKAKINQNIIKGIGGFFVITMVALLVLVIASIKWSADSTVSFTKLPDLSHLFSGPVFKGFIFFDVVLVLFLFDSFLRKKRFSKQS